MKLCFKKIGIDAVFELQILAAFSRQLRDNSCLGKVIATRVREAATSMLNVLQSHEVSPLLSKNEEEKGHFVTLSRMYLELTLVPLLKHVEQAMHGEAPDNDYLTQFISEVNNITSWFNVPEEECTPNEGFGTM